MTLTFLFTYCDYKSNVFYYYNYVVISLIHASFNNSAFSL